MDKWISKNENEESADAHGEGVCAVTPTAPPAVR